MREVVLEGLSIAFVREGIVGVVGRINPKQAIFLGLGNSTFGQTEIDNSHDLNGTVDKV